MKGEWFIITPYYREEIDWIKRCVDSVKRSANALGEDHFVIKHLLVADGVYRPEVQELSDYNLTMFPGTRDYGDTPRFIGFCLAYTQGAKAISFLDADNWFFDSHLPAVAQLYENTKAQVVTTSRAFFHLNGDPLDAVCLTSDGEHFCDTSCLTLFDEGVGFGRFWGEISDEEHAIDDRVVWDKIKENGAVRAHTDQVTIAYRARASSYYRDLGEPIPNKLIRDNREEISNALIAYHKRTGQTAELDWRYSVPYDKPYRAKKLALGLISRGEIEKASPILSVLRTQLGSDLGIQLAYEISLRANGRQ